MAGSSSSGIHLANAYVSLSTNTKGLRKEVDQAVGGATAGGDKHGRTLGGRLAEGFKKTAKVGFVGAGAVAGGALVKGFGRLRSLDEAEAKLSGLGHSSKTVQGIMDNALNSVKGTAFGMDEAASTAAGAVAAGVKPGKDLESVLTLVGDAATIGGSSMSEMGAIFNKVASTGKIQGDVIAQLGDQGIPILQFLAEELGVSAEEVSKMASAGEIDFATFRNAMESGLGGAAQDSGKTFSGAFANMGAAAGRLGASLLSGVFPQMKGGFGDVTALLDRMGPAAEVAGQKIGAGIAWAGDKVGAFVADFKAGEGAAGVLRSALESVAGFITGSVVPALSAVGGFLWRNREAVMALAGGVLAGVVAFKAFMFIKTVIAAVKAARLAVLAFNASLLANPIALVVAAIAVLVGALIYLYRNNDKARAIMQAAWRGIQSAISFVVAWIKNVAWPVIQAVFRGIGSVAKWLWKNAIAPAFRGIGSLISWWYNNIVKRYFSAVGKILRGAGKVAMWLWRNAFAPAFRGIAAVAKWLYANAIRPMFARIGAVLRGAGAVGRWLWQKAISPAFRGIGKIGSWLGGQMRKHFDRIGSIFRGGARVAKWLYDNGIRPAFNSVADKASWLWGKVKWAFDKLKSGASSVKNAFVTARDGISRTWSRLNENLRAPIRKALSWMNSKFIGGLNTMLKKIPGVNLRLKSIPGFARGGWTGPGSRLEPAGIVHADEFVVNKRSRRRFEKDNPGALDHINRTGRMPGYYIGGKVQGLNKRFLKQLAAFNKEAGGRYTVNSGYRDNAKQAVLYARYLAGRGPVAAKPGSSMHNKGLAADLAPSNARDVHAGLARKHGLVFTVPSESWHIEPAWGRAAGAMGALSSGGGGGWLPEWASNPLGWIKDKVSGITKNFPASKFGIAGKVLPSVFTKIRDAVGKKVQEAASAFGSDGGSGMDVSGVISGVGVRRWSTIVRKALYRLGQSPSLLQTVLRRMQQESGGNPRAINNWDSNARRGTPSKGLMQVIDPTFRAYAMSGYDRNIWDPMSNILASMRYALSRYGSLSAAYNRAGGYAEGGLVRPAVFDQGGTLAPGVNVVHNKLGRPEPLRRADQPMQMRITSGALTFDEKGRAYIEGVATAVYEDQSAHDAMRRRAGAGGRF